MEDINFEIQLEKDLKEAVSTGNTEWAKWIITVYWYWCIELPEFVYLDQNDDSVIIEKEGGEIFLRISSSEIKKHVTRRFDILNETLNE